MADIDLKVPESNVTNLSYNISFMKGEEALLPSTKTPGKLYFTKQGNLYLDYNEDIRVKITARSDNADNATKADTADKAIGDKNGKDITNYLVNVAGRENNTSYTITKTNGANTTSDTTAAIPTNKVGSANTSSKIFLVGTTAQSANAQVGYSHDTVYIDTNGKLNATVKGDLEGTANKANSLTTPRNIGLYRAVEASAQPFNGANDISIPINGVYEGYLKWGGVNHAGTIGPIDMAIGADFNANRWAFLDGSYVTVEYSNDNGATWIDYGLTNAAKTNLLTQSQPLTIGHKIESDDIISVNDKIRITVEAIDFYTSLKKIMIRVGTNGASGGTVKIEESYNSSDTVFVDVGTYDVAGWSGWNVIPLLRAYGGNNLQLTNTRKLRFTFSINTLSDKHRNDFQVYGLRIYGENSWLSPSNMARTGHLYDYDTDQNAMFPGDIASPSNITAKNFFGDLVGNADSATLAKKNLISLSGSNGATGYTITPKQGDNTNQTALPVIPTNQAGSSNTSSKFFLIGTTSQSANSQTTYSRNTVFVDANGKINASAFVGNLEGKATSAGSADSVNWANVNGRPTNAQIVTAINKSGYKLSYTDFNNTEKVLGYFAPVDQSTGIIPIQNIPKAALDNLVKVANLSAMYQLTTAQVQTGDSVYVTDIETLYLVVDDSKLNSTAGYQEYKAGAAASVEWADVKNKPILLSSMSGARVTTGYQLTNKDITNTNYTVVIPLMGGATSSKAGEIGLVPKPAANQQGRFLRGDGTWAVPNDNDTKYTAGAGLSLDGTTFKHSNSITSGSTANTVNGNITLGYSGTFVVPAFSYDAQGHITVIGSTTYKMPASDNTDTHYTTHLYAGTSTGATNATATDPYLILTDNTTVRNRVALKGTGIITIKSDNSGNVTFNAPNTAVTSYAWANGGAEGPKLQITLANNTVIGQNGPAIPAASATVSGVVTTGNQTFAGVKTFSTTSGFVYSGIEEATGNAYGHIWFDHMDYLGKPVYNSAFSYNPSTTAGGLKILNTTTSTSITSGALIVSGGVGISGPTYLNRIYNNNTNNAFKNTQTDASIYTKGGIAAEGNIMGEKIGVGQNSTASPVVLEYDSTNQCLKFVFA